MTCKHCGNPHATNDGSDCMTEQCARRKYQQTQEPPVKDVCPFCDGTGWIAGSAPCYRCSYCYYCGKLFKYCTCDYRRKKQ